MFIAPFFYLYGYSVSKYTLSTPTSLELPRIFPILLESSLQSLQFFGDIFSVLFIHHCFICRPSDSTVSEDAGIKSRKVATSVLVVRRSNHSARSHPQLGQISSTVDQISSTTRSHPQLGQISSTTRLDLIHNSASSYSLSIRSLFLYCVSQIQAENAIGQNIFTPRTLVIA